MPALNKQHFVGKISCTAGNKIKRPRHINTVIVILMETLPFSHLTGGYEEHQKFQAFSILLIMLLLIEQTDFS